MAARRYSRKSVFKADGPDNKIYVMYHATKKSNVSSILEKGFRISRKDCRTECNLMLGPGLYLTRDIDKTRYYGDVCFKVLIYVGKTKAVNSADKTWHVKYDSAYLPPRNTLVPSGREETCIKSVSQIEILGIAYGYDPSLMSGKVRNLEGTGDQLDEQEKIVLRQMINRMSISSLKWPETWDTAFARGLRREMVADIEDRSNLNNYIASSVLKSISTVPRHLFMEPSRVNGSSHEEKVRATYAFNKAMGATRSSNESSPEIIASQLSLINIEIGNKILLVGGKGGYINALVAQIVGVNGKVVTVSSNKDVLDTCKARVGQYSPLKTSMEWKLVSSVQDTYELLRTFNRQTFDAVIYCGATKSLPSSLVSNLCVPGGSILAPVEMDDGAQQFRLFSKTMKGDVKTKKINFGVIFGTAE